jgi:fibronectin-binding autotransporter adhesin
MRCSAFDSLSAEGLRLGGANVTGTRQHCRSGGLSSARTRGGTLRRLALLAGVSLAALATLAPVAHAVDGIWTGGGAPVPNEWTQDNNWSLATVPDNVATFTNNGAPTSAAISDDTSINTIQFTAGAPAFNFVTSGTGITFDINGAGIVNNSAFAPTFTNNDNLNFNNASSAGNATITNNNGGVVSFNNNSTAANATIITNNGALTQFNNNSTAASATILTNSGGLTQFNDNSSGGNAQFIANAGGIVDFSNTSGPNGDGNISAGSIAGAGNYFLGSNQLTVGSNNLSTTVSGVISDCGPTGVECSASSDATGGGLTKVGSGTLTLTGASTYTGDTNVNEGVLNVTGSLVSGVTVNSGGMLTGTGTIGGLSVGNGGIVAPGSGSIGTLRVAGDLSFDEGSIYQVKANAAGKSAMIIATGAASIDGGTVQVLAQSGTYARQTRYTILTASGGVDGQFTDVTSNLAFLTPLLSYDPNNVFLTLIRNDITFASVAQTPNQRAVAAALDSSPPLKPLVQAVANLTLAGTLQAFDALSGEVHGSVQTTMIDDSRYIRQAVLGRLRQAPYAGADGAMAALGSGGPILAYAEPAASSGLAYGQRPEQAINQLFGSSLQTSDLTFWAQGVGAWGRVNSDGNAADLSRNLGGVFTGFDGRFGEWRAGLAGGYTNASASVSARASSATIDTAYFAGYGGTSFGALNFRSGAALAWHTIGTSRSIAFPGFSEQASARYSAVEGQVFGEIGYGMSFGDIAVEPFAGLAWVYLNTESFNETGGVGALGASGTQDDVNYFTLGARWASTYLMPNGMMLMPRASLAWQHAFGTVTPSALLTFQSTSATFGILGVPIARDAALVEAGGDLQLGLQTKVGVAYFGQLASNARDHSVKANFSWRF